MKLLNLLFSICIIFLVACGPSKEEIAQREKFISDSIAQIKEKERIHNEMIEVGKSKKKNKLTTILESLKENIDAEEIKLKEINEFHFGRLPETKEKQVSAQNKKISELNQMRKKLEEEISLTNLFRSFDFQTAPEYVIIHVFNSAKNNDLSNLRYLIDPYGEFTTDCHRLGLIQILPFREKQQWLNTFKNGRIIGDPDYKDDHVVFEIAIGKNSDKITKIELVKRIDKWYILDIG